MNAEEDGLRKILMDARGSGQDIRAEDRQRADGYRKQAREKRKKREIQLREMIINEAIPAARSLVRSLWLTWQRRAAEIRPGYGATK